MCGGSEIPYKTVEKLPQSVRDSLPEPAQSIFLRAFNAAYEEYGRDDETAMKIAWSAVKKAFRKEDNGNWVKMNRNYAPKLNSAVREDVGWAWKYPNTVITKQGVMNGQFKPNSMIDVIQIPKVLPVVIDHPPLDKRLSPLAYLDLPMVGIGLNGRINTEPDDHEAIVDLYIPKELPLTNDRMLDEELVEVSIVFSPEPVTRLDEKQSHKGKEYSAIENSKKIYHVALMETQFPACSLEDGCGVPCECRSKKPEVNNLDKTETPDVEEVKSEAEVPVNPIQEENPEPVTETTQEEDETKDNPIVEEPPVNEVTPPVENNTPCEHIAIIANLNSEIVSLRAKIGEMTPGYNSFIENRNEKMTKYESAIKSKIPSFNSNGMSVEQLEQVALAINGEDAEKAQKEADAKLTYAQVNSREETKNEIDLDKLVKERYKKHGW